jgi:hypothetical protein
VQLREKSLLALNLQEELKSQEVKFKEKFRDTERSLDEMDKNQSNLSTKCAVFEKKVQKQQSQLD